MKAHVLIATAVLTGALAAPVLAHTGSGPHVHAGSANVILGPLYPRPAWAYRIDPSVLHPIPKRIPIPVPGPGCLSCPPMPLDEQVILPQLIQR